MSDQTLQGDPGDVCRGRLVLKTMEDEMPQRSSSASPENIRLTMGFFLGMLFGVILQIVASWIEGPVATLVLIGLIIVLLSFSAGRSSRSSG